MGKTVWVTKAWLDRFDRATDFRANRLELFLCWLAGLLLPQAVIMPLLLKQLWFGVALGFIGVVAFVWMMILTVERRREIKKLLAEVERREEANG